MNNYVLSFKLFESLKNNNCEINDLEKIKEFIFAGKAIFTIKSLKTGTHFTFKIKKKVLDEKDDLFFVYVLINSDDMYKYIGTIFNQNTFRLTSKSKISNDAQSYKAFEWFFRHLMSGDLNNRNKQISFYHEGKCGRCGKALTNPESIESGIGPTCKSYYKK